MTETIRLSPSIAYKLLADSPLSAWANHRLLGDFRKPTSDSQRSGRAWHSAVLEGGEDVVVAPYNDFRTNEAKEFKANVEATGEKIAIAQPKYSLLEPGSARIRQELRRYGIEFDGEVEHRFEWIETTSDGDEVNCSGVLDHFNASAIHDMKTSAEPVSLRQAAGLIADSHALLQDAAYKSALSKCTDIDTEGMEMVFAFVQTREPHAVTPVILSGEFQVIAEMRWQRAIDIWHRCLSQGTDRKFWPGPVDAVTPIPAPGWMLAQEIELEAMGEDQ